MGDSYLNLLELGNVLYEDSYPNPIRIMILTSFWKRTKGALYKVMRGDYGEYKSQINSSKAIDAREN